MAHADGSLFAPRCSKERVYQRIRVLTGGARQRLGTWAVQSTQWAGRLVVDPERVPATKSDLIGDIVLGDRGDLHIPKMSQEATVLGEVQSAARCRAYDAAAIVDRGNEHRPQHGRGRGCGRSYLSCSDPSRKPANLRRRHLHLQIVEHRGFGNDCSPFRGRPDRGLRKYAAEVGNAD
jgi:hypothetical protein